jgi:hypothetical protein
MVKGCACEGARIRQIGDRMPALGRCHLIGPSVDTRGRPDGTDGRDRTRVEHAVNRPAVNAAGWEAIGHVRRGQIGHRMPALGSRAARLACYGRGTGVHVKGRGSHR